MDSLNLNQICRGPYSKAQACLSNVKSEENQFHVHTHPKKKPTKAAKTKQSLPSYLNSTALEMGLYQERTTNPLAATLPPKCLRL